ncbi:MAG: O-antigen ligase family protein, partial [Alphaproteobacteria bacterium]|nr:O-antigen ligase family protein [Alphaproteobacteria bacterium]
ERENEAACLLAMTMPVLLWLGAKGHIGKVWFATCFCLLIYGVLLTGSNTGFIATAFGLSVFALACLTWRRTIMYALGFTVLVIGLTNLDTAYLPQAFQKRVLTALATSNIEQAGTFGGRMALIHEAMGIADKTLVIGVGGDQYRAHSQFRAPVHNAYLLLWTEGGIFSFVGILMIISAFAVPILYTASLPGEWLTAVCGLTVIALFILLINASAHVYGRFWLVPLLVSVGLCMQAARRRSPGPQHDVV